MHINHEYELKLMLDKDEYEKLLQLECEDDYIQTNYYFDTHDFSLFGKKIVLRIRKKNDNYELTVKTKSSDIVERGVILMEEKNFLLDNTTAESIICGSANILDYIDNEIFTESEPIDFIGKITTLRTNIRISEEMPIAELDKSIYDCITDYELEWEISNNEYEKAVANLKNIGITMDGRSIGQSKYGRLVDRIRKGK